MFERIRPLVWTLLVLRVCPITAQTTKKISFAQDVAPILSRSCMQCHGLADPMANLDLRTREGALKGGQHGPAIVPGNAAASHLYKHVAAQEAPQMPLGGKLSQDEVAVLKSWIDSGAEWDANVTLAAAPVSATEKKFTDAQRKYWAFQKVVKPAVPSVKAKGWVRTPVDAFILAKLEEKNLKPNPPADKVTLLRRAYFDLIGLPPTPEQVQALCLTLRRRHLRRWSPNSWLLRATASGGAATGWTWRAMPTRKASKPMRRGPTSGAIATT